MADQRLGNRGGFAAVGVGGGTNRSNMNGGGSDPRNEHDDTDYASINALRTRLAAIDAGYYTAARLNTMTYNDMVYAVRVADSPTTIKQ